MEQTTFAFGCSSSGKKSGNSIFRVLQGDDEGNFKWGKDIEGENHKKVFSSVKEIILNTNLQNLCVK